MGVLPRNPENFAMGKSAAVKNLSPHESLEVAVVERKDSPGTWSVEAIDNQNEGACYVTVFYGPDSEARAREYFHLKYGR